MPEIQPFRGIVYDVPQHELAHVIAPPYDVIPPDYQDELYARDPRNVVRMALNRQPGDAAYADAARHFASLLAEGVLRRDERPALYVLAQTFGGEEGESHTRLGLLARLRAETPERGGVLPHEHTRAAAKEDRFKLLVATRANFSAIFNMVTDEGGALARALESATRGAPAFDVTDDEGVRLRLWRLTDSASVDAFRALLADARAYIADGHHRHATALRFGATPGGSPFTLGYFTPLEAPGLVVLPYHRILARGPSLDEARARLAAHFALRAVPDAHAAARGASVSRAAYAFGLAQPGAGALVAEARPEAAELLPPGGPACLRALDTWFVHHAVLGPLLGVPDDAVSYVHSLGEAEQAVAESRCRLALLLRATPVRQIVDVAEARESMPAKSTFFYPKLPSGLVIHAVDE